MDDRVARGVVMSREVKRECTIFETGRCNCKDCIEDDS
jgi:hypothetical protein